MDTRYQHMFETSLDGILLTDMEGHIMDANRAYQTMVGYSLDELKKLTYQDLTPEQWHSFEEKIVREQIMTKGHADPYEKAYIRKDGTIFPVNLRVWLIKDDDGNPIGMWGIFRDMSYQLMQKEVFGNGYSMAHSYFYMAPVFMIVIQHDETVIDINNKGLAILECSREDIIGHNWFNCFVPEDERECVKLEFQRLISGVSDATSSAYENTILNCNGKQISMSWYNSLIRDRDGKIIATISTGEDITRAVQLEHDILASNGLFHRLQRNMDRANAILEEVKENGHEN